MTEMVNGIGQSQSTPTELPVTTSPAPSQAPAEERSFRQSEVNDLIGRAKTEAVERYKRESSLASHQASNYSQQTHTMGGMPQPNQYLPSEDMIRRTAAEEAQRLRDEWVADAQRTAHEQEAHKIASEIFQKIETGKSKYQDYDDVMRTVNLGDIPHIAALSNTVDNTADVLYELAKNPSKIGNLHQLVSINPQLAVAEMRRLSQSIKDNAEAANYRPPNEPLSQLRPSNQGTDNKGALTVSDYKRKYKV